MGLVPLYSVTRGQKKKIAVFKPGSRFPPNTGSTCILILDFAASKTVRNIYCLSQGFPWWLSWYRICLQCRRPRFHPWAKKIPWRKGWLSTPVFLPGDFHGQRSLVGYSPWGHKEPDMTEQLTLALFSSYFRNFLYTIHAVGCMLNANELAIYIFNQCL